MTERKQFRAIKGTRDILPPDSALWDWFEETARETFAAYNFREIRVPIFEETSLFARSIGTETDVVAKEMYTFNEREAVGYGDGFGGGFGAGYGDGYGSRLALRPEATAGVVRAYIENGMHTLPGDVKLYCIGPMFRRERPQKGRYRQFYQIDAEVLGQSDAPAIDAEVIEMLLVFFRRVGLTRTKLYLNSIGDKQCRPKYVELLREELRKVQDRLGTDSQRRIETNALRVLDSKLPEEQAVIEKLPRIADHLCDPCREHFMKLKEELSLRGIEYEENWRLVRGLDYYTRTTFEVTAEGLGSQNAVCGGGRYDGLVELLGGPPTKGIGFAIGSDRAILSIQESGDLPQLRGLDVFIAWMGKAAYPAAVALAQKLRGAGFAVQLPPEELKFKKSLGLADKLGARYALILGENEIASGKFALKDLAEGRQQQFTETELLERLKRVRREWLVSKDGTIV